MSKNSTPRQLDNVRAADQLSGYEEAFASAHARAPTDDGRASDGVLGDDRAPNRNDRPRRLHPGGISAHGHGKGRGVAAISDCRDDRAREESGAGTMAQARHSEYAPAAPE